MIQESAMKAVSRDNGNPECKLYDLLYNIWVLDPGMT